MDRLWASSTCAWMGSLCGELLLVLLDGRGVGRCEATSSVCVILIDLASKTWLRDVPREALDFHIICTGGCSRTAGANVVLLRKKRTERRVHLKMWPSTRDRKATCDAKIVGVVV